MQTLYAKSHVTPDYQQRERDTEPGGSGRDVPGSADSHKFHLHERELSEERKGREGSGEITGDGSEDEMVIMIHMK